MLNEIQQSCLAFVANEAKHFFPNARLEVTRRMFAVECDATTVLQRLPVGVPTNAHVATIRGSLADQLILTIQVNADLISGDIGFGVVITLADDGYELKDYHANVVRVDDYVIGRTASVTQRSAINIGRTINDLSHLIMEELFNYQIRLDKGRDMGGAGVSQARAEGSEAIMTWRESERRSQTDVLPLDARRSVSCTA